MTEDTLYSGLLALHIAAGFAALFSAFVAAASKMTTAKHRAHVVSGRVFFWAMLAVFATAIPMTFLRPNQFLFLVALFSFYLAYAGWRLALNRTGEPLARDWAAVITMVVTALVMLALGGSQIVSSLRSSTGVASGGVVLVVFGTLGGGLARLHWSALRARLRGTERIALHISMMMGATISTVTAFVVVNGTFLPDVVAWISPTLLLTPVIVIAQRRLRLGSSTTAR